MLSGLSIRDIVLIEKLDLDLGSGLTVLTGETGAGKSILLDSLSLAIGARADRALVRSGAEVGQVRASFDLPDGHPLFNWLETEGYESEDGSVMLRRQITADGRSKAWINDSPASRSALADIGARLVEIHGQHDDRGLLDPVGHRRLLDSFAAADDLKREVAEAFKRAHAAAKALKDAETALDGARAEEDLLRHAEAELASLNVEAGEEDSLAKARADMMQGEKLAGDLKEFRDKLTAGGGADATVRGVLRRMERLDSEGQTLLSPVMESLSRAAIELGEGMDMLDRVAESLAFSPADLEDTEERLFAIRQMARKHDCGADDLPALLSDIQAKIQAVEYGDQAVKDAREAANAAEAALNDAVTALSQARREAAQRLDAGVNTELAPLKLEKAAFRTHVTDLPRQDWSAEGSDRVEFEVKTNPSTPFGPLTKIASGGETARFILALKVVLGEKSRVPVMIFDEVDRGIGGATADAVGERLERLSKGAQLLVVTHSPQVAARGNGHLKIAKSEQGTVTRTGVTALDEEGRREEIARMLAGAEITPEARAAADRLLAS